MGHHGACDRIGCQRRAAPESIHLTAFAKYTRQHESVCLFIQYAFWSLGGAVKTNIATPPAFPHQARPLLSMRCLQNTPTYETKRRFPNSPDLPSEDELDLPYLCSFDGFVYTPRKHWCLLAEIEDVVQFGRVVLEVKDKTGARFRLPSTRTVGGWNGRHRTSSQATPLPSCIHTSVRSGLDYGDPAGRIRHDLQGMQKMNWSRFDGEKEFPLRG